MTIKLYTIRYFDTVYWNYRTIQIVAELESDAIEILLTDPKLCADSEREPEVLDTFHIEVGTYRHIDDN